MIRRKRSPIEDYLRGVASEWAGGGGFHMSATPGLGGESEGDSGSEDSYESATSAEQPEAVVERPRRAAAASAAARKDAERMAAREAPPQGGPKPKAKAKAAPKVVKDEPKLQVKAKAEPEPKVVPEPKVAPQPMVKSKAKGAKAAEPEAAKAKAKAAEPEAAKAPKMSKPVATTDTKAIYRTFVHTSHRNLASGQPVFKNGIRAEYIINEDGEKEWLSKGERYPHKQG